MAEKIELVTMEKNGERMAMHPTTVEAHIQAGWSVVGTAEVDGDGNAVETGKVIETPAHTIETSDGFLKVLPKVDKIPPEEPVKPVVIVKTKAKPKK